jgi:site-specific recombinase
MALALSLPDARAGDWDLTALLNAADPRATLPERHLWLIRLMEWLRHGDAKLASGDTPMPVLRLRQLLNALERNEEPRSKVATLLAQFWAEVDAASLFSYTGFAPRMAFASEFTHRLRLNLLPATPATTELAELFGLLFPHEGDADWLLAIDDETLARLAALMAGAAGAAEPAPDWQRPLWDAITFLISAARAAGLSPALRQRISTSLLVDEPFRQLGRASERVQDAAMAGDTAAAQREVHYLRALLEACRKAAASVGEHLEEHGVSVDIVFEVEQLIGRMHRVDELLTCLFAPQPQRELLRLVAALARVARERRSLRALFAQHYSLLARKVAERSAETGEHYITRTRAEYMGMLRAAAGGGAVVAGTVFLKFFIYALGLSAFWAGMAAGLNYAVGFVFIQLQHWTLATKQPAMTAPAMAHKLTDLSHDEAVEGFVDEVAHLLRTQIAGIVGNLAVVGPLVLAIAWAWQAATGGTLVRVKDAEHALHTLSLLGPTPLFAAFTGVLLFASSQVAGWAENSFVFHRLDSAIAWNPRIVARLGPARAQAWARWWRTHVSGLAANVSLGFMLGLLPALLSFVGLPLDVRHVTLSTGQLAAALATLGPDLLRHGEFWWCVASLPVIGALNLAVSFWLAFRVALRSRRIRVADRGRIYRAIRARFRRAPLSFVLPPRG